MRSSTPACRNLSEYFPKPALTSHAVTLSVVIPVIFISHAGLFRVSTSYAPRTRSWPTHNRGQRTLSPLALKTGRQLYSDFVGHYTLSTSYRCLFSMRRSTTKNATPVRRSKRALPHPPRRGGMQLLSGGRARQKTDQRSRAAG